MEWLVLNRNACNHFTVLTHSEKTATASLQRGKNPPSNVLIYDTKQSDGERPVILELWGMRSTSFLPSLPGPLCLRVVAPDRFQSMGQIELNYALMLNWIHWNRAIFTYKMDLVSNNLQYAIKPNQTKINTVRHL